MDLQALFHWIYAIAIGDYISFHLASIRVTFPNMSI